MTCIVGMIKNGNVYLGSDSKSSSSISQTTSSVKKVFKVNDMVFGSAGSWRVIDVLKYSFIPPHLPNGMDVDKYMRTLFITKLREVLKYEGCGSTIDGVSEFDASILVGYKGRLFNIDEDYQVGESIYPYEAIGSGRDVALGSLYNSYNNDWNKYDVLEIALNAASLYSVGVGGPFNYISTCDK